MRCCACKEDKPPQEFWFRRKTKGQRQSRCKPCVLLYQKEHYRRSEKRRADISRANTGLKKRAREFIVTYLREHPCEDCGEERLNRDHVSNANHTNGGTSRHIFESLILTRMGGRVVMRSPATR